MPRSLSLVAACLLLAATAACAPPPVAPGTFPGVPGETLATVNGKQITKPMYDTVLRAVPDQVRKELEKMGTTGPLMDTLVAGELFYQEALLQKLDQDPLIQQDIAMASRSAIAEALVRKIVAERATDARIQAWYDEHKVQFSRPQVDLAHIMLADGGTAQAVRKEIDAGGDFAALARAQSKDSASAPNGGDIGWLDINQLAPPVRSLVENAPAGAVIGPLQLGPGWHIFKVVDIRRERPLDDVKTDIVAQLEQEVRQEYLNELKAKAVIVEAGKEPTGPAKLEVPQPGAPGATPPAGGPVDAPAPAAPPAGGPADAPAPAAPPAGTPAP